MTGARRPTIEVRAAVGGWPAPWPNVAELAAALPHDRWTLVGGLMTQLHSIHHGLGILRPTNDVDVVLHVETERGAASAAATALEQLGYSLQVPLDPRATTAHRFVRDTDAVDLITSGGGDAVDVMVADHAAPSVVERLRGREMIRIDGGTQALRRTVGARLEVEPGVATTLSVPRPFGAVVLKAAAYLSDARDRRRHLLDAVVLLGCIEDPLGERDGMRGSDRRRLLQLAEALEGSDVWRLIPAGHQRRARSALRLLLSAG